MPNTYSKIYIQLVFGVKHRACVLSKSWRADLFKYMAGIIQKQNHLVIVINGVEDHVHILLAMRPHQALSDLVRDVKSSSSRWINEKRFLDHPFYWQSGFGAFSYTPDAANNVERYIHNQEEHHRHKNFRNEYEDLLKRYHIEYDEKYLFQIED